MAVSSACRRRALLCLQVADVDGFVKAARAAAGSRIAQRHTEVFDGIMAKAFEKAHSARFPTSPRNNASGYAVADDLYTPRLCAHLVPLLLPNVESVFVDASLQPDVVPSRLFQDHAAADDMNTVLCTSAAEGRAVMLTVNSASHWYSSHRAWTQLHTLLTSHVAAVVLADDKSLLSSVVYGRPVNGVTRDSLKDTKISMRFCMTR